MCNGNILSTKELANYGQDEIGKSNYSDCLIESLCRSYIFSDDFSTSIFQYLPATIIYTSKIGYHKIEIGDRGQINHDENVYTLEEICFKIFRNIAFNLSLNVLKKHGEDWRRELFKKRLDILGSISKIYFEMEKKEIEKTLLVSPYIDK